MPYIALRPGKYAGTLYLIGDTIPDKAVDPKAAKRLQDEKAIRLLSSKKGQLPTGGPSAADAMITLAKAVQPETYTADSYKVLTDAVAETVKVCADGKATAEQISAQLAVLSDAIKALIPAVVQSGAPGGEQKAG